MDTAQLDYFSPVTFINTNTTIESKNTRRTMIKYLNYFNDFDTVTTVQITNFVRNLFFKGGLKGRPVSRRYIENVILTILPELRRAGKISYEKLDLKRLWINLAREKNLIDKQSLLNVDTNTRFNILNNKKDYFKLDGQAIVEILKDCRECLLLNDKKPDRHTECMAALLLTIATGARTVSTVLKFTRPEILKLFSTGRLTCMTKHVNNSEIFIIEKIRITYCDFFQGNNLTYPLPITRRVLVYWYKNYIYNKFGKPLHPHRVLHEIRTWYIGHVYDTMGIRIAAKSVSHKNIKTTQAYVNRSVCNIEMKDRLTEAFKDINI